MNQVTIGPLKQLRGICFLLLSPLGHALVGSTMPNYLKLAVGNQGIAQKSMYAYSF